MKKMHLIVFVALVVLVLVGIVTWMRLRSWPSFVGMNREEVIGEAMRQIDLSSERELLVEVENVTIYLKSERDLTERRELTESRLWRIVGGPTWLYNALEIEFSDAGVVLAQRPVTEIRQ